MKDDLPIIIIIGVIAFGAIGAHIYHRLARNTILCPDCKRLCQEIERGSNMYWCSCCEMQWEEGA